MVAQAVGSLSNIRILRQRDPEPRERKRVHLKMPVSRLITTAEGMAAVTNKVTVEVAEAREDVTLLYQPIYRTLRSDDLPRNIDTNFTVNADVVFLQRWEAGEVIFGRLTAGTPGTFPIVNYSGGFEWTRETEMFNENWRFELLTDAFGRAYNALLNHLHLSPILTYSYTAANQTPADATAGADIMTRMRNTLVAAYRTAAVANRPGSVLLAHSSDRFLLADSLSRRYDNVGNVLPAIDFLDTVIFYDGMSITVGDKTYAYTGVTPGKSYLIRPREKFWEAVKTEGGRDFTIETDRMPDVTRRIAGQTAAHTYRGVYADIANSVEEITHPV